MEFAAFKVNCFLRAADATTTTAGRSLKENISRDSCKFRPPVAALVAEAHAKTSTRTLLILVG